MASQTGIAGSTKVGKNCMFGGQVGLAGHITIGDNVKLGAQSGVMSSIDNNSIMIGSPVMDQRQYMKSYAVFRNLPQLRADINQLQRESKSRTNE